MNSIAARARAATVLSLALVFVLSTPAWSEQDPGTWNLSEIYASDASWDTARGELAGRRQVMDRFKGRLGESAATLKEALDAMFALQMEASRIAVYAAMRADEDQRESGPQGMLQAFQSVASDLQAATAWIDPELLSIPRDKLASFVEAEPGLSVYGRYLERLEKRRPHVLDPESEKLLGMASRIQGEGSTIGGLLRNAEIPWPTITLSDGSELRVNVQGYTKGRAAANRDDRAATFAAFYEQLQGFKGSLAASLSATVQEHVFASRVRSYDSSLDAALAPNEVDPAVYRMLVQEINASLPTLHRYLKLRGRILGIDDLRYHDIYPPLVPEVASDYSWENAKKLVAVALEPLGDEYVGQLGQALDSGWVDVYPRPGKRAGAYVNDGAYEVHPYMLLNFQEDYASTSTLAHEAGHLMHSWFSQKAQPYPTSSYAIFVAEVASTVNEVLLFRDRVAAADSDEARLSILGSFLEGVRGTVFRQTMFAEFELAIHEMAERGEPLTGDGLNALYGELLEKYHGEAQGVMQIDEPYFVEWAFVPHFHYNFYVYQYATSYVAAIALAEGIQEDRPGARARYMEFLSSGSTRPPVELLQAAGVDMTSPEPIRAAMRLMNEIMDRIEEILARSG
jgi:oligoendopeptidase F